MTTRLYSSISQETSLVSALTAGAGTMVVNSASVLGGITPAAGETLILVIDPDTALEEIVEAVYPSNPSSTTITINRNIDGTTAQPHSAGAKVRHMGIGRDFREANKHIEATTSYNDGTGTHTLHGIAAGEGSVVGTAKTQTLTNKTIDAASNTITNIGTSALADGSVTTAKLANDSVTAAKIVDGTITSAELAAGSVGSSQLATGAVGTVKIDDTAVTEAKLAPNSVTAVKIATDAVTTAKIQDGAVTTGKIADGTIVNADINVAAAIDKTKISGTAITAGDTGTVTSTMIADGTIVNGDISGTAGIAYSKLSLGGTITSADLVDGTIVATDIADGTITAAKMVSDPYARANHTGTQTASTISDFDTQVRTSRLDQMAAPTSSVAMNAQKITGVADPTLAQDASTKAYVDAQVNALVNGAPGTLDTIGEIATALSSGGSVISTVVLRDGSQSMTGPLTLSGAPSSNLHAATKAYVDTVAGSASAAAASAAAAEATYDNFDDRYLGAKASAPSVDNDGNALLTGALYWNTVDNAMYVWKGSSWGSISSTAEIFRYRFNATGGETSVSGTDANGVTLSYLPGKEQVYLNGIMLVRTTDYSATNGTSITSLAALSSGDVLEIITFTAFDVSTAVNKSTLTAKGSLITASAAQTPASLNVGTDGYVLKADSSTATGLAWGQVSGSLAQPSEPSSPSDGQIWVDTDGTIAGTAVTRWSKTLSGSTSTLSGTDDASLGLTYVVGNEQVFLNGVLLSRGNDYTATDGTSISLTTAGVSGDIAEVIASAAITIADTYTQAQVDSKLATQNAPVLVSPEERWTVSATAATGTINFDADTQGVIYYTSNASADWTLNVRGSSSTTLNSKLSTGDSFTLAFLVTQGGTAYKHSALTIDGSAQTVKWSGGTAPSAGNASSIDIYQFTIIKTASATYTVLGAGPVKYA